MGAENMFGFAICMLSLVKYESYNCLVKKDATTWLFVKDRGKSRVSSYDRGGEYVWMHAFFGEIWKL